MIDDNQTPLNDEERDRLRRARIDVAPPRGLEERTVAALRERGMLRPSRRPVAIVAGLAAAAVLIVAATAWLVAHRSPPADAVASVAAGPRYMLLLYGGSEPVTGPADDRHREYAQWASDIASRGVTISGEELAGEMRVIGAATDVSPTLPRGFFIVQAPDLAAAERLASTCPHLRHGGRILITRIAG